MQHKTVFTSGCFDILHSGHVRFLEQARDLGDTLIVAVNGDESVRKLKGDGRPVMSATDRIKIVSSLRAVDGVRLFEELTPIKLVKSIMPDIYVKGSDWENKIFPERSFVESYGGQVIFIPIIPGKSSSDIIATIIKIQDNVGNL